MLNKFYKLLKGSLQLEQNMLQYTHKAKDAGGKS